MKARTSRARFDETRRFNFVGEEMGRPRMDADANEQSLITRTDIRRRTGDLAEGSPDDGFLLSEDHLLADVGSLGQWDTDGLPAGDARDIRQELSFARRDPESLPYVVRVRGATALRQRFTAPLNLLRIAIPLDPLGRSYQSEVVVLQMRFERPPTDDEIVDIRIVFVDEAGVTREVAPLDPAVGAGEWRAMEVPLAAFAAFPRSPGTDGADRLIVRGWGLTGLPPRAEIFVDSVLVRDPDLPETDVVLRGGTGTVTTAGRIFVEGRRTFIEQDWRYSLQPDLPNPPPLHRPVDLATRHLLYIDLFDRPVHAFEDDFLEETALGGEPTSFRSRKVTQIRAVPLAADQPALPPEPMGNGRLTTNMAEGVRPDRFPAEDPDPCRDRCLFSENLSSGDGYRGKINAHIRIEVLHEGTGLAAPIIAWSRENAAQVVPLLEDAPGTATSVVVGQEAAALFAADDLVVLEDNWTRLDPGRGGHRPVLRRLRAVDTATGRLEFFPNPDPLTDDPAVLNVGGPAGRAFLMQRRAAVRRWDGADWALTDVRYNLRDGIDFGLDGGDLRAGEYWSFTARIEDPDGGAFGVVEDLRADPVHGPERVRAPIGLIEWSDAGRRLIDLRRRFMPLEAVRDRLIELGNRRLSPGAFTVVVGDGVRTFGDVDQNIAEGVTGDEAIQTALTRLGGQGGTIYVRAGDYILEHPVILQARSAVRILGDGDATRLQVTGAGGAFHLDACGIQGQVSLELMHLEESPAVETPFGAAQPADIILGPLSLGLALPQPVDAILAGLRETRILAPADLALAVAGPQGLVSRLGERLRTLRPGFGRIGASIVQTLARLRRLQRENPGQPLEVTAPDELAVLQGLPHGVVTLCDCRNVDVTRLTIRSRAASGGPGTVAAGVLVTGDCAHLRVQSNDIEAPAGIVALPYARYLSMLAIITFPRSVLFLDDIHFDGNAIRPFRLGRDGIAISDGRIDGLRITSNRVTGFLTGISVADRAESRSTALDRIVLRDNQCIDTRDIGISVDGDGVDIEACEVRLAVLNEDQGIGLRAGIRFTGSGSRLRDCWISMPRSGAARDPLALEAGVLIGAGSPAFRALARPVSDLEVIDTRIEGAGAETLADGIVLAGPQPVHDLRLSRNLIQNLGGSGIRAMGHGGATGSLQILDNRIEDVARASMSWGGAPIRALIALEPRLANLGNNATPRSTFDRLLALDTPSQVAIDALLRWMDTALLRGGIVLTHVEGADIARNALKGIGSRIVPNGFRSAGAEMRTAGILVMGGRDISAPRNRISNIVGVVEPIVFNPPPFFRPARPPVLDAMDRLRLEPLAPADTAVFMPADALHDTLSGLRGRVAEYALADDGLVVENRAGLRMAVDTVLPSMRASGGELAVIAGRMAEANQLIADAAGEDAIRQGADALRAAASDAAGITAPDTESAEIWSLAGALDRATLTKPEIVSEQATMLARKIEMLPDEQARAVPELAGLVRAVLDQPADQRLRRQLAAETGKLAMVVATAQNYSAPEVTDDPSTAGDIRRPVRPATENLTAMTDLSTLIARSLARDPNLSAARRVEATRETTGTLITLIEEVDPVRARTVRRAFDDIMSARTISENRVAALRRTIAAEAEATIAVLRDRVTDPDLAEPVVVGTGGGLTLAAEAARRTAEQQSSLLALTAKSVDTRLAEAASFDPLDETFELKLAETAARNLVSFAGNDEVLRENAKQAFELVSRAAVEENVIERARLREQARVQLDGITTAGKLPGVVTESAGALPADRIGGLTQLALEIGSYDDVELRKNGVSLFGQSAERMMKAVGIKTAGQEDIRNRIAEALEILSADNPPQAYSDTAIATLASVASTIIKTASKRSTAAPETEPLAFLTSLTETALNPNDSDDVRVDAVNSMIRMSDDTVSLTLRDSLLAAPDLPRVLDGLRRGVGSITGLPPFLRLPPPILNGVRAHPADGIYCGAVAAQLRIEGNAISTARVGIVMAGSADHPLAPTGQTLIAATIRDNIIERAPIAAFDLRPEGDVALHIKDNEVRACSGAADPDRTAYGQAVMTIIGRGELDVNGNKLAANGNNSAVSLLHEVLIDWRGDITLSGNRIRHSGGASGGTGLLVITADLDPGLVARLSREPSLVVEPLPRPVQKPGIQNPNFSWIPGLLDSQIFAMSMMTDASSATEKQSFDFGSFTLADAEEPKSLAAFAAGSRPGRGTEPAVSAAATWLAIAPVEPVRPMLGFLSWIPPLIFVPPARARRSVQVVGNDIVADGPALQVLNDGGALISGGVTGNELECAARTAAVYLRHLDAVVFTGNRCEALEEVNVAVLRCGNAAVTASSNGLVGDQPAALPPKPLPPKRPFFPGGGFTTKDPGLSLKLDLGFGTGLALPINPEMLLNSLQNAKGEGVFKEAAGQAEASFKVFAAEKALDPAIRILGSRDLLVARDTINTNLDTPPPENREQQELQLLLQDPSLSDNGKLYGVAKFLSFSDNQARTLVSQQMAEAGGDTAVALDRGITILAGSGEKGPARLAEKVAPRGILEELIGYTLADRRPSKVFDVGSFAAPPKLPPPLPRNFARDRSLVIIGGAKVAAVGNATSSGVYVHPGPDRVLLNI